MADILIMSGADIKQQNKFLMDDYPGFIYSAVYGYLFEGLYLRDIEAKYLGRECQGFFAKNVLNFIGIDTSKKAKNCGRYAGMDVNLISKALLSDKDPMANNIGRILSKKLWLTIQSKFD